MTGHRAPASRAAHRVGYCCWWDTHEVAVRQAATERFQHPVVGLLELDCEILLHHGRHQLLVIHTARPGTDSYERLRLLRVVGLQDMTPQGAAG